MLAADRWVHRREWNESDFVKRMDRVESQITNASQRASERHGSTTKKIGRLQLDMREVQTTLKIAPHIYEPSDID
jgi:hypothetical protein